MLICLVWSGSGDLKFNLRATPVVSSLSFLLCFFLGGDLTGVLPGVGNASCSAGCTVVDLLPGAALGFAAAFAAVHFALGAGFDFFFFFFEASNSSSVAWGAKNTTCQIDSNVWGVSTHQRKAKKLESCQPLRTSPYGSITWQ